MPWNEREKDRQAHANKCLIKQSELAPGAKKNRYKKKKKKNTSNREREK
jgi:hypothetical protein